MYALNQSFESFEEHTYSWTDGPPFMVLDLESVGDKPVPVPGWLTVL